MAEVPINTSYPETVEVLRSSFDRLHKTKTREESRIRHSVIVYLEANKGALPPKIEVDYSWDWSDSGYETGFGTYFNIGHKRFEIYYQGNFGDGRFERLEDKSVGEFPWLRYGMKLLGEAQSLIDKRPS